MITRHLKRCSVYRSKPLAVLCMAGFLVPSLGTPAGRADGAVPAPRFHRAAHEHRVRIDAVASHDPAHNAVVRHDGGGVAGVCPGPVTATHTDANFDGGQFVIQAGFEEGEIAAASYVLDPAVFPIRIELVEGLFAHQDAPVPTTTEWTMMIWDGTPDTGTLVASISSDGDTIPHLTLPPGTAGAVIQVVISPDDPEQIFITNDSGTNTFSVGFRIDAHDVPGVPCTSPPPPTLNAFPTTDVSGLDAPAGNWIFAVDGVACACGSGWLSFEQLPFFCTPSGDWVIRAQYTCTPTPIPGACCDAIDGTCLDGADGMTNIQCDKLGGDFQGPDTICKQVECPQPLGACCFDPMGCLDFPEDTCAVAGGAWQGPGTECAAVECFATGACCRPDGTCDDDLALDDCIAAGGTFQGGGTLCADANCPQPLGACCLVNGACLELPAEDCSVIPASIWAGPLTTCADDDNDGVPDACGQDPCPIAVFGDVSPPSGTHDARQPHPPDDNTLAARQGIGSSDEPIVVTLGVTGATAACFSLCETGEEPGLGGNTVTSAIETEPGTYELVLHHPIAQGHWTSIAYGDSVVSYASNPADTDHGGLANANDVLQIIDYINGAATPPFGIYSTDIDHTGTLTASDILRVIDLLNGAGTLVPRLGADPLPQAPCIP
ncbi:MAG: hypothetical protein ACE5E6_10705 [Phycisphaerae bacterium]